MNQCELRVSGDLWFVSKQHVQQHRLDVQSKKKALKQEFQHDRIASHKKNSPADLQPVCDDDSTCYIVYDIVYDIAYHIAHHIGDSPHIQHGNAILLHAAVRCERDWFKCAEEHQ